MELLEWLDNINSFITIISLLLNLGALVVCLKKAYHYIVDIRKLKILLGYKDKYIIVSQSLFVHSMIKGLEEYADCMMTYNSVLALNKVGFFLKKCNIEYDIFSNSNIYLGEMHLGGPITNKYVNSYMNYFFDNFKYVVPFDKRKEYENYPINTQVIEYSENRWGFKFYDKIYNLDSKTDYAVLIKLTKTDFKNQFEKTVHIIFGGSDVGMLKGVEFFENHYKILYEKFKKDHYFIVISIDRVNGNIIFSNGIEDLTDIMFN